MYVPDGGTIQAALEQRGLKYIIISELWSILGFILLVIMVAGLFLYSSQPLPTLLRPAGLNECNPFSEEADLEEVIVSPHTCASKSSSSSTSDCDKHRRLNTKQLRGRKRKRFHSDEEEENWMLQDQVSPHKCPLSPDEYIKRLEKGFTGRLPDGEEPQFLFIIKS